MRHQKRRGKLGVKSDHRKALLRNLVCSLVERKRIQTTVVKAKHASSLADQMVTIAKRGDLHARRLLVSRLGCTDAANTLITEIAPRFKERKGGYTRILRVQTRPGDGAQLALLEFTEVFETPKKEKKEKKKKKAEVKKETAPEKPKKGKTKAKETPKKEEAAEDQVDEKKESEKRGGFLGSLRKFLKGDE